jgi:hypothetical protein
MLLSSTPWFPGILGQSGDSGVTDQGCDGSPGASGHVLHDHGTRVVKISERVALLVVASLIKASRSDLYRGNYQCQTKLLSADRQPFQRTADLATRAGHWPV